ncbi:hypothetical protein [Isoptericola nanjingensis]|uniref:hypothetical protein n=1 Tax=Isoptericola TaxID=254250 RepID=UPI0035E4EC1B|nr:hypothetical protein [Isoptericola sp. QY 916]
MGIFSRRTPASPGPVEPFELLVDTVFAVPTRGHVLTGTVTSGRVRTGQPAVLHLPTGEHAVTVTRIDVRRRKADDAEAGTEAAVYLGGLGRGALPVVPGGDGSLIDAESVRGCRLVSTP